MTTATIRTMLAVAFGLGLAMSGAMASDPVAEATALADARQATNPIGQPFPDDVTYELVKDTYIYPEPNTSVPWLGGFPAGIQVVALPYRQHWVAVELRGGRVGFVPASAAKPISR